MRRFQAEFLEELKNQETEEWAVARRRLPRLHDWLDSWESKIRLHDNVEADTFAGKKINEVRSAIESIQLLRGDEIADEHWTELIPILGLKVENPRDITLGHLLGAKRALTDNEDRVKVRTYSFKIMKNVDSTLLKSSKRAMRDVVFDHSGNNETCCRGIRDSAGVGGPGDLGRHRGASVARIN